jgi:hypothetical protein
LQVIGGFLVNIFRLLGGVQLENASKKAPANLKNGKEENTKKRTTEYGTT